MKSLLVVLATLAVALPASVRAEVRTFDLVPVRVIELDGGQMSISGNSGGWLEEHLGPMIRQACEGRRDIVIAVSGQQFDEVAATQDRVAQSGRYRSSSRQLLLSGQMVGPSEHFSVSVLATTEYRNQGGGASLVRFLSRGSIDANIERVDARVEIVLEPISVGSGLHARGIRVTGSANEISRASLSLDNRDLGFENASSNPEERLVARAASKAIDELIDRLAGESRRTMRLPQITLTSEREIRQGNQIVFSRERRQIASYEVLWASTDELGVRILWEKSHPRERGDSFKIR